MKSFYEIDNAAYTKRLLELTSQQVTRDIQVFEFEGDWYLGNRIGAVKDYLEEDRSDTFYVWLQKNEKLYPRLIYRIPIE